MYKKILFIFILLSLFTSMYIFRHYISLYYFQNDVNKIAINIELNQNADDILVCFNKSCDKMDYNKGLYSYNLNANKPILHEDIIKNIEIISKQKLEFSSISLFVSSKFYYFTPLDVTESKVEFNSKSAYSINIPFENNNKTFIQKISIYFESIFYNWYFYIAFYVLLLVYVIKYKPSVKINFILILLLAFILRLSHIDFISLWNDELYTLCHISDMGLGIHLKNTFSDPGNPPLFFIISNIWLYFFNKSILSIRFLPLLIGIFQIYSIYFVLKNILNKKTALIGSFLCTINLYIILESNEIRSYILSMTLILWSLLYFYKLKNKFSNKNIVLFSIISICLINTHYYCVLYVIYNFISGLIIFKNNRIKYLLSNIIIFSSFVPYFLISKKIALSNTFNLWIEKPTLTVLNNHVVFYYGHIALFLLTVIFSFVIYKKLNLKEKSIFLYTTFSILFVFITAFLISIFIKPILFERYFCIFLPYLIINTSIFLNVQSNPIIFALIFLFSINMPKYENFNLFSNINFSIQYAIEDSKKYKDCDIVYVIPDSVDYLKYFPDMQNKKIIVSDYQVREDIDLLDFYTSKTNKNKKTIIYLPEICVNSKIKFSKSSNIKRINTTFVPIYKIVLE